MNDRMTFKNREKWVGYAEHLRQTNYAIQNLQLIKGSEKLLLKSVKSTDEMIEIEKKADPLNELWNNVDLSIVKIGGFYKRVQKSRSFSFQDKTEYYHVLCDSEKEDGFVECETITLSNNGIYARLEDEEDFWADRIFKKTFAIDILDKRCIECSEEEFNMAKDMYINLKKTYHDSRK